MPDIFISAGEASGDHYGAEFMRALRERARADSSAPLRNDTNIDLSFRSGAEESALRFFGLGGAEMRAAGFDAVVQAESVAHMGITEVLAHAPGIYRKFQLLKSQLQKRKPQLAVLIDFPDVNFRLAKEAKRLGIPVLWLVSPQLWAWKKRRLRWVQQRVAKMLVIFPFEEKFYRERGVDAEFIGHPLADLPLPAVSREEYARQHRLDAGKHWIALLPGSRRRELALNLQPMLDAADELGDGYEYLLPVAATLSREEVARAIAGSSVSVTLVDDARAALHLARASVVASGTATVQAALIGNPFVIVYRMSALSYALARRFVSVAFAGMPNLIAEREIVPELLQNNFTAEKIISTITPLLRDGAEREQQMSELRHVAAKLRCPVTEASGKLPKPSSPLDNQSDTAGAMARAARAAVQLLTP